MVSLNRKDTYDVIASFVALGLLAASVNDVAARGWCWERVSVWMGRRVRYALFSASLARDCRSARETAASEDRTGRTRTLI